MRRDRLMRASYTMSIVSLGGLSLILVSFLILIPRASFFSLCFPRMDPCFILHARAAIVTLPTSKIALHFYKARPRGGQRGTVERGLKGPIGGFGEGSEGREGL